MKKATLILVFFLALKLHSQIFSGSVYMKDNTNIFLNQVYVTNLNEYKTVLSDYNGAFNISVKEGDVVRFTSIVAERRDIKITKELLERGNSFVELKPAYYNIEEVVIKFKPSGNLRKDVLALKSSEKAFEIAKMIGLPEPKGDGNSPFEPAVALNAGLAFNIQSIYDILSGERKKKERLYEFERMSKSIAALKGYFGESYFAQLEIPKNYIDNFLQFVYSSDNLSSYVEANNLEGAKPFIEKYLPVYQKRLKNSHLTEILN